MRKKLAMTRSQGRNMRILLSKKLKAGNYSMQVQIMRKHSQNHKGILTSTNLTRNTVKIIKVSSLRLI